MNLTMTTDHLKAKGFTCRRAELNVMGGTVEHYAIFHSGARVTSPAMTPTTARAAWDDLRHEIETGRIEI